MILKEVKKNFSFEYQLPYARFTSLDCVRTQMLSFLKHFL